MELINEAISLFSQVYELIKLDSNQEDLLKDLAYELMQIQQNLFAIKVLKHILKINPLDETSMLELGVAFHEAGKFPGQIDPEQRNASIVGEHRHHELCRWIVSAAPGIQ